MTGFELLLGHLVGDYLIQNDWMAGNKTHWSPPAYRRLGHTACTVHCLLYTLAVWAFTWRWLPWWGLVACFAAHWPIDRFRLARRAMTWTGQEAFATGPCAPWSVIVVDNIWHLLTLYGIWLIAGSPS